MHVSAKSFVADAAAMLVLGTGSAVAATGGHFLVGRTNTASNTTTIKDTKGTPLSLTAKSGSAPLRVNTSTKVAQLNADLLDGVDSSKFLKSSASSTFARTSGRTGEYVNTYAPATVDLDGDGTDDSTAVFATCPSGSVPTGGGAWNPTGAAILDAELVSSNELLKGTSGPVNSYLVVASGTTLATQDSGADFGAYVYCYDPKGALPAQKLTSGAKAARSAAPARLRVALASLRAR